MRAALPITVAMMLSACGAEKTNLPDTATDSSTDVPLDHDAADPSPDFISDPADSISPDLPADWSGDGPGCIPPQTLIVLDRTLSMGQEVDGMPKWFIAIGAIESMLAEYEDRIWFGLELFPRAHPDCNTVSELLAGERPDNPHCEPAEVEVAPGPDTAGDIEFALADSVLCISTPLDLAVLEAVTWFTAHPPDIPQRDQVVILITDGRGTCDGTPACTVTTLTEMGVHTFVIGFGDEVDTQTLSDMACAGDTALDPTQCDTTDPTCTTSTVPSGQYHQADDIAGFEAAMDAVAAQIDSSLI